jgi:hypothetical protein
MCVEHHIHTKASTVQDPDRWCPHSAWGQECWQLVSQGVWNLRLELGHQMHPDPVCTVSRLLLPSHLPHHTPLPLEAMLPLRWGCPGKLVESAAKTLLSSPMGRCGAPLIRGFPRMSNAEKPLEACASCMEPASAVAVPVRYAKSVNGVAKPPKNLDRYVCCSIPSGSAQRLCSGVIGVVEPIGAPVCNLCATSVSR